MSTGLQITRALSLRTHNTFGIDVTTPLALRVDDPARLPEALAMAPDALILGGGSNLLLVRAPDAVLELANDDIAVIAENADHVHVRCGAGAVWHDFVMATLQRGWSGLENLALIPGAVGASPIQNIGAYGVEVMERIIAVDAWDRTDTRWVRFDNSDCAFTYRDSRFKHEPDRYVVTAVEFRLDRQPRLRLDYAGIRDELAAMARTNPNARDIADAVIRIRRRKLPDPAVIGNAGSFFKNPIVAAAVAEGLRSEHADLPVFPAGSTEQRKLSAAWLIDRCGWKGHRDGDAGVSAGHALVLVNHGHATGAQLLDLARRIAVSVRERFGVAIEPEPRIIGSSW
ncbi:UDP-N-acetylmuramate dehydrogenase [Solilutibacter silvestris]|uniref:UDP-N-acetylenolpyruvoylglucosamine reductase n=1 Tax=Solilutibacter silvestris TaxID=1645665 RepID=A0A2K1PYU0_9GAMM|nr:UDP-N-acetylmuramate dehydrogenase [Lysobacter silvestris]PNS07964.1 murB: UDP-N-acetylenolpyruvoylglucosamine reductase [Lysobacter silvestris]